MLIVHLECGKVNCLIITEKHDILRNRGTLN